MRPYNICVDLRSFDFAFVVLTLIHYFFLGWKDLPHVYEFPAFLLGNILKRLNILSAINNVSEVVVIIILNCFLLPALAINIE